MEKVKVVILDSGIDKDHKIFSNCDIIEYAYDEEKSSWGGQVCEIKSGHGTAVASALIKFFSDILIFSFKVFYDENNEVEPEVLIDALNYIYDNVDCDIINISLGVHTHIPELEKICNRLSKRGIIIVAAFCNEGLISYPAAYDSVIGVDSTNSLNSLNEYIYVNNSIVNIGMKACVQRLAWTDKKYVLVQGNSFLSPIVVARICEFIYKGGSCDSIHEFLSKNSKRQILFSYPSNKYEKLFKIKNAALFPFNKETKSLIRYSDKLPFSLKAVYDSKYSGNLGLDEKDKMNKIFTVENINDCNWDEIDTLIIGHCNNLESKSNINYKNELIYECCNRKINVVSFDDIGIDEKTNYPINIYIPKLRINKQNSNKFGKLYQIDSPVLGIVGTSSHQGKFTLQLELRDLFIKNGYTIGQLSSEPEGALFGMDEVYPYGYNGVCIHSGFDNIEYVNSLMHQIDLKKPDIILIGAQSGTCVVDFNNISSYNIKSIEYLLGARPDAMILCINYHDTIEIIERSVKFLESLVDGKVIALSLFPMGIETHWNFLSNTYRKIDFDKLNEFRKLVEDTLELPCSILGEHDCEKTIYNNCIDFFSTVE